MIPTDRPSTSSVSTQSPGARRRTPFTRLPGVWGQLATGSPEVMLVTQGLLFCLVLLVAAAYPGMSCAAPPHHFEIVPDRELSPVPAPGDRPGPDAEMVASNP